MPILLRGLRSETYELVKKAATCAGNMCALIVNGAELAPFLPELNPALEMALEHSSPAVRAEAATARDKLLEGVGELQASARKGRDVVSELLRTRLADALGAATTPPEVAAHMGSLGTSLLERLFAGKLSTSLLAEAPQRLAAELVPLAVAVGATSLAEKLPPVCEAAVEAFVEQLPLRAQQVLTSSDGKDYLVDVQNCILAFAGRVLLKKADIRFQRGHRYGLIGQNGVGKTTLLNRLSAGDIRGFPPGLNVHYIRHEVVCEDGVDVVAFCMQKAPAGLADAAVRIEGVLAEVGFTDELRASEVNNLSGGWKMKLSVAISILHAPELLLLDEPTNHVDVHGVAWLTKYVQDLSGKEISSMIVSHDSAFLDAVAQDMCHYEKNRKLKVYKGNLSEFVKIMPEAKAYYELASENIAFSFPDPGMLEGVTSRTKALIKMKDVYFKYPTREVNTLNQISVQVSMASRVAVIGVNGAGKSTLIKLMVGEIEPNEGEGEPTIVRHPNMRLAYVAQHAFHHIENHLEQTPVNYIEWRFAGGMDREGLASNHLDLTEEEELLVDKKPGQVGMLRSRRKGKKGHEYEVCWFGHKEGDETQWMNKDMLLRFKWTDNADKKKPVYDCAGALTKLMMGVDERIAFEQSGIATKKLTALNIQKHLDNFNLEMQFGTYSKIGALSGGQKVKVVLAAAMWMEPHIIILDEPTNFLDRDSLGALATAVKNYAGGCIIISHQREFYSALCPEVWSVVDGRCTVSGSEWMDAAEKARKKAEKEAAKNASLTKEDKFDAFGNKIEEKQALKKIPKSELKKLKKRVAEMRKAGQEVYTDEEVEKEGYEPIV